MTRNWFNLEMTTNLDLKRQQRECKRNDNISDKKIAKNGFSVENL